MSDTITPTAPPAEGATCRELGERYADILRGEIQDGTWGPDRILRRADLAHRFGVSPEAVIRAVRLLVREGLVEIRRAVGARPTAGGRSWNPPQGGTQAQHIENVLRARITDGTHRPGERLPSLRKLAPEFEVSHSVIASALKPLTAEDSSPGITERVSPSIRPISPRQNTNCPPVRTALTPGMLETHA